MTAKLREIGIIFTGLFKNPPSIVKLLDTLACRVKFDRRTKFLKITLLSKGFKILNV